MMGSSRLFKLLGEAGEVLGVLRQAAETSRALFGSRTIVQRIDSSCCAAHYPVHGHFCKETALTAFPIGLNSYLHLG